MRPEHDVSPLGLESLHCRFAVDERHYEVAGLGGRLLSYKDEIPVLDRVTVPDPRLIHRIAHHAEKDVGATTDAVLGNPDPAIDVLLGEHDGAGRHFADERDRLGLDSRFGGAEKPDAPGPVPAFDVPFLFEPSEVPEDCPRGADAEGAAKFLDGRRQATAQQPIVDGPQDVVAGEALVPRHMSDNLSGTFPNCSSVSEQLSMGFRKGFGKYY